MSQDWIRVIDMAEKRHEAFMKRKLKEDDSKQSTTLQQGWHRVYWMLSKPPLGPELFQYYLRQYHKVFVATSLQRQAP